MNNNGKGTSIFYGVIGVATLVITIIGATFAYFSATTNSEEGVVSAGGATLSLGYTDIKTGTKTDLIPIDVTLPEFNNGGFVDIDPAKCKDVNNNNICSVYQFTISNPGTNKAAQRVYGTITPSTNTFTNFRFAVFKGTAQQVKDAAAKKVVANSLSGEDIDLTKQIRLEDALKIDSTATVDGNVKVGWDVDGVAVTDYTTDYTYTTFTKTPADAIRKNVIGNPGDLVQTATPVEKDAKAPITIDAWEQVLDIGEAITYTIVMWIPEMDANQNVDQGKAFAAAVNFTTEGNNTGVTGVLSTTSQ